MKILLADDHAMVRSGLNLLLTRLFNDVRIVEAGDYSQALQLCRDCGPFSLILVDLMMPGMAKGGGLHALCQQAGSTPVVVLSASEDPTHVHEALSCGARGYLPKATGEQVLFSALQLVLSGGTYLPMTLLDCLNAESTEAVTGQEATVSAALTPRQMDVLNLVVLGKTNKDIAREFDISPATVQSHLNAIFRALAVKNRTQAVHVAGRMGLLQRANGLPLSTTA